MNYNIKLDLSKITGAFVRDLKGATATKKCLIIPVDDAGLFVGQKGVYLDAVAVEMQNSQYGDSHFVRISVPSVQYKAMTDEQRKAIPIIGSLKPVQPQAQASQPTTNEAIKNFADDWQADEVPF